MRLVVRLFAVLRERAGRDVLELGDLPDGLDVGGLKRALEERHPELGSLAHVRGVVGTSYVSDAHALDEGADVSLLPPVSGGSGESGEADLRAGVFELCASVLDVAATEARVAHPSCGAVCSFTGTTRDTNRGRDVVRLEYEAFEAMTGPEMARIFARCRAELGEPEDLRMLCRHRVGAVAVGEPSVVIAVASAHRDLAFRACRFLIDELKETLPIWKKEHYAGGAHWIGDRS
jgi:molybdopterin synthase catalytic subunit